VLEELQGMGRAVAELDPHSGALEVLGDQRAKIRLIFDDNDEGLGARPLGR
jgi:hypothetical protein